MVKMINTDSQGKKGANPVLNLYSPQMEPQSGFIPDVIRDKVINNVSGDVKNLVENITLFLASLYESNSYKQVILNTLLFIKTNFRESLVSTAIEIMSEIDLLHGTGNFASNTVQSISEFFDNRTTEELQEQAGFEFDFIQCLKQIRSNWKLAVNNPAFLKVSKFLSMMGAMGMCDLSNMKMEINGVRLFSIEASKKMVNMSDFVEAALEVVTYFVEGGYKLIVHGDPSVLLYGDDEAADLSALRCRVVEHWTYVAAGNSRNFGNRSEMDFAGDLNDLIVRLKILIKECNNSFERNVLKHDLDKFVRMRGEFEQIRVTGKLRESPMGLWIDGPPGVGKSYTAALLTRYVLKLNGFSGADDRIITLNDYDQYMSNANSAVEAVNLDDVGNTKPEFVQNPPTAKIIDLVNNVPFYANMAELEQKGRIALNPGVVCMTSNLTIDAVARMYSLAPESIMRRAHLIVTMSIKDGYENPDGTLNTTKVRRDFGDATYPDVQWFTVKLVKLFKNSGVQLIPLHEKLTLEKLIQLVRNRSLKHFSDQRFFISKTANLVDKINICEMCKLPVEHCECVQGAYECACTTFGNIGSKYSRFRSEFGWTNLLIACTPEWCVRNNVVLRFGFMMTHDSIKSYGVYTVLFVAILLALAIADMASRRPVLVLSLSAMYCVRSCQLIYMYYEEQQKISKVKNIYHDIFAAIRNHDKKLLLVGKLGAIYAFLRILYNSYKLHRMTTQGNLAPSSVKDIEERDNEVNPWAGSKIVNFPGPGAVRANSDELLQSVQKNLFYMRIVNLPGGIRCCNALFPCSNMMIIPRHMWHEDELEIELIRGSVECDGENVGHRLGRGKIHRKLAYHTAGDLSICPFFNVAPSRDIIKLFPSKDQIGKFFTFSMPYVNVHGGVDIFKGTAQYRKDISVGGFHYQGYNTRMDKPTFNGLCMSPAIVDAKCAYIGGVHLAGNNGRPTGALGIVTIEDILEAKRQFEVQNLPLTHNGGVGPSEVCGKKILEVPMKVHPKSCTNHVPPDGILAVYGSCAGRVTPTSEVVPTMISDTVADVFGKPNVYGPPKFHKWKNFNANLEKITSPTIGFSPVAMSYAVKDYSEPLLDLIRKSEYWMKEISPLNDVQTVSGIDGKRFIDAMPLATSMGMPFFKPKRDYIVLLNEDGHDCTEPKIFIPEIMEAIEERRRVYLANRRAYAPFKASLKDEPTKVTKEKVRVFFGADVVTQFLVRKYFLPVLRFMGMNPLLCECAVGINAQGPEWHQLREHIVKFGEGRILAGDYSSYDTRMPAQVTLSAWNVLIEMAKITGNYDDDDIIVMRGLMTDCCYPTVAFNGDLIGLTGLHASGINVTANAGSVMNALMKRCAFYDLYMRQKLGAFPLKYRDYVSDINYGDDCKGSVSEEIDWFNHITLRDYLAEHEIVFTMPDKESEAIPFLHDRDADFLKRRNRFDDDLQFWVGPLDVNSIFKSLHAVLASKHVTPVEQACANIDGALREMFFHGRTDFEDFRSKLQVVASRHGLEAKVPLLECGYDWHIANWRNKYLQVPLDEEHCEELDVQSGFESEMFGCASHDAIDSVILWKHCNDTPDRVFSLVIDWCSVFAFLAVYLITLFHTAERGVVIDVTRFSAKWHRVAWILAIYLDAVYMYFLSYLLFVYVVSWLATKKKSIPLGVVHMSPQGGCCNSKQYAKSKYKYRHKIERVSRVENDLSHYWFKINHKTSIQYCPHVFKRVRRNNFTDFVANVAIEKFGNPVALMDSLGKDWPTIAVMFKMRNSNDYIVIEHTSSFNRHKWAKVRRKVQNVVNVLGERHPHANFHGFMQAVDFEYVCSARPLSDKLRRLDMFSC